MTDVLVKGGCSVSVAVLIMCTQSSAAILALCIVSNQNADGELLLPLRSK